MKKLKYTIPNFSFGYISKIEHGRFFPFSTRVDDIIFCISGTSISQISTKSLKIKLSIGGVKIIFPKIFYITDIYGTKEVMFDKELVFNFSFYKKLKLALSKNYTIEYSNTNTPSENFKIFIDQFKIQVLKRPLKRINLKFKYHLNYKNSLSKLNLNLVADFGISARSRSRYIKSLLFYPLKFESSDTSFKLSGRINYPSAELNPKGELTLESENPKNLPKIIFPDNAEISERVSMFVEKIAELDNQSEEKLLLKLNYNQEGVLINSHSLCDIRKALNT